MNITPKGYFLRLIMAVTLLSTGSFGISGIYAQQDVPKPFSGRVITPEKAKPFKLVAPVMEIHPGREAKIVVAEKTILITEYQFVDQVQRTQLIGGNGQAITLQDLKKGELVTVEGLKLTDGTLVGERIQVKPKRK